MKKDKEWLKEKLNTEKYYRETSELKAKTTYGELYDRGVRDGINVALEFIEQLDEPEKPVIPQFVADWVESRDYCNVYMVLQDLSAPGSPHASKDVRNWIFRNQENVEKFVRAWLDDYEVEKEPVYYAKIKGHELVETETILDEDTGDNISEFYHSVYFVLQKNGELVIDMKDSGLSGAKHFMTMNQWNSLGINETNADFEEAN